MNILALDLGTNTGYAAGTTEGSEFTMGTWKLATKEEIRDWGKNRLRRRRDPRPRRLCDNILKLHFLPDIVVFEDVEFSSSTYQTQLWSSLRAGVWMCFGDAIMFDCVPVATLKKFATGSGKATKELMAMAFNRVASPTGVYDDNAIDAYFIWKWAKQNLSRAKL